MVITALFLSTLRKYLGRSRNRRSMRTASLYYPNARCTSPVHFVGGPLDGATCVIGDASPELHIPINRWRVSNLDGMYLEDLSLLNPSTIATYYLYRTTFTTRYLYSHSRKFDPRKRETSQRRTDSANIEN